MFQRKNYARTAVEIFAPKDGFYELKEEFFEILGVLESGYRARFCRFIFMR
jgi:hypothetical protein